MTPTAQQTLQRMDIFDILGAQGTNEEKEAFLEELQDVIWQEVFEKHVSEKLTDDDVKAVEGIIADEAMEDDAKRVKLFEMLRDKVPDLDSILLDRTVQLKADMLQQRLEGMKEFYASNADATGKLSQAEQMWGAEQYQEMVDLLNTLLPSVTSGQAAAPTPTA